MLLLLLGVLLNGGRGYPLYLWHFNYPSSPGAGCTLVSNPNITNGYLSFSPGYASIGPDIVFGGLAFTITTRVLFRSFTNASVIDLSNPLQDVIAFAVNSTYTRLEWGLNRSSSLTCPTITPTNTWLTYSIIVSGNTTRIFTSIYVDGNLICSNLNATNATLPTAMAAVTRSSQLLGKRVNGMAMDGAMDFLWYLPRSLSALQLPLHLVDLDVIARGWTFQSNAYMGPNVTLVGAPTVTGNALTLSNIPSQYGQVNQGVVIGGPFTMHSRVMMTNWAFWSKVFDFGNGRMQDNIFLAASGSTSTVAFSVYQNSSLQQLTCTNFWQLNQWMDVTAVVAGATATLYKNGVQFCTGSLWEPTPMARSSQFIGKSNWVEESGLIGNILSLIHFPRALPASSISYLTSTMYTPIVYGWHFLTPDELQYPLNAYGAPSVLGGSLVLNGNAQQWLQISSSAYTAWKPPYTFAFRVNLVARASTPRIFEFSTDTGLDMIHVYVTATFGLIYEVKVLATAKSITCAWPLDLGVWYDVAVTQYLNQATLYMNGQRCMNGSVTDPRSVYRGFQGIGRGYQSNLGPLNGKLDYFIIFNRTLTQTEIINLPMLIDRGALKCTPIGFPANSRANSGTCLIGDIGTTCDLACNSPYQIVTASSGSCTFAVNDEAAAWDGSDILCAVQCPTIVPPQYGTIAGCDPGSYGYGYDSSWCSFTCSVGFILGGSALTCNTSGVWAGDTPTCTPVTCPAFGSVTNGQVSCSGFYGNLAYQAACIFQCDPGFGLRGNGTVTCRQDGTWSAAAPTCATVQCPSFGTVGNGTVNCLPGPYGGVGTFNSQCFVTCKANFDLIGSGMSICQGSGQWSSARPTCRLTTCPALNVSNGRLNCTGGVWGPQFSSTSRCKLNCYPGYNLYGSPITCQPNSTWTDTVQTCADLNECLTMCNTNTSTCYNTVGDYACGPRFISDVTSVISGTSVLNSTTGEVINTYITIGHRITLSLSNITYYQPSSSSSSSSSPLPKRWKCLNGVLKYIYNGTLNGDGEDSQARLTCTVTAGLGANFTLSIPYTSPYFPGQLFTTESPLFSYPAPIIYPDTLHFPGGPKRSVLYANDTSEGEYIAFEGANFLPDPTLLTVTYGTARTLSSTCTLGIADSSTTIITCRTAPSTSGVNLVFTVNANGQIAVGNDTYSVVDVPTVQYMVSPSCSAGVLSVYDCPAPGGVLVTIHGLFFSANQLNVRIAGMSCLSPQLACDPQAPENCDLTCLLPAGTGYNQTVVVSSQNKFSQPLPLLSYARPSVTSLRGCMQGSDSLSVMGCTRAGGDALLVGGVNFGASQASITIGGLRCTSTTHDINFPQTSLTCITPRGSSLRSPLQVFQQNGPVSQDAATVGYMQCSAGLFQNGSSTVCAQCAPGTYSNVDGSAACTLCDSGRYAPNSSASTCLPCDVGRVQGAKGAIGCDLCDPGFYMDGTAGVQCFACDAGTNQSSPGGSECDPCDVGRFSQKNQTDPTGAGPLVCEPCPLGMFSANTQQVNCDSCAAGRYANLTAMTLCLDCPTGSFQSFSLSSVCNLCNPGMYAPVPGRTECNPCEPGTAFADYGATACTSCTPGRASARNFSVPYGPLVCEVCALGWFMDSSGQGACLECPVGRYSSTNQSSTCQDCAPGSHQDFPGSSACNLCSPGFFTDVPARVTCNPCVDGTSTNITGASTCEACAPGSFSFSVATAAGITDCTPCPPGYYINTAGQIACSPCEPGYFSFNFGAISCDPCPTGTFQPDTGARQCSACPPGLYTSDDGRENCDLCPPGKFTGAYNSIDCMDCSEGTYQLDSGAAACIKCPPGTANSAKGQRACTQCTPGTFSSSPAAVECDPCPKGSAAALPASSLCPSCQTGMYSEDTGESVCLNCAPGKFAASRNSTTCTDCSPGKFQLNPGATGCDPCLTGSWNPSDGQSTCQHCSPGSFSSVPGAKICAPCPLGTARSAPGATICTDCIPGRYASATGREVCGECSAGRMATVNSSACMDCVPGSFQTFPGMGDCTLCPAGSSTPSAGSEECTPCPAGSAASYPGSPFCSTCAAGTFQPRAGQTVCENCTAGTYSLNGKSECTVCGPGLVADAPGLAACTPCPKNSFASDNQDSCLCIPGFFWNTDHCTVCPVGSVCSDSGVTRASMTTRDGYYLISAESLWYMKCLSPKSCMGGKCIENKVGVLCNVCAPGYSMSEWTKDCMICGSKRATTVSMVFTVIALLLAVAFLYLYIIFAALRRQQQVEKAAANADLAASRRQLGLGLVSAVNPSSQPTTVTSTILAADRSGALGNGGAPVDPNASKVDVAMSMGKVVFRATNLDGSDSGKSNNSSTNSGAPILQTAEMDASAETIVKAYITGRPLDRKHGADNTYALKIAINFFQILSSLVSSPLAGALGLPQYFMVFVSYFKFFNIDFIPWQNVACLVPSNYFTRMSVLTTVPLGLIFGLIAVASLTQVCDRRHNNPADIKRRATIRLLVLRSCIFTTFVLYPLISSSVLSFFACLNVGKPLPVLTSDFTLSCYTPAWHRWSVFAGIMVVVYPVGIPVMYFVLLFRNRKHLDSPFGSLGLGFLHESYSRNVWWFELPVMAHKLALTSIIQFFPQSGIMPAGMVVAGVFIITLVLVQPELRLRNWLLHMMAQIEIFLLLLFWHFIYKDDLTQAPKLVDIAVSTLFITLTVIMVGFLFWGLLKKLRETLSGFVWWAITRQARKEVEEEEVKHSRQDSRGSEQEIQLERKRTRSNTTTTISGTFGDRQILPRDERAKFTVTFAGTSSANGNENGNGNGNGNDSTHSKGSSNGGTSPSTPSLSPSTPHIPPPLSTPFLSINTSSAPMSSSSGDHSGMVSVSGRESNYNYNSNNNINNNTTTLQLINSDGSSGRESNNNYNNNRLSTSGPSSAPPRAKERGDFPPSVDLDSPSLDSDDDEGGKKRVVR